MVMADRVVGVPVPAMEAATGEMAIGETEIKVTVMAGTTMVTAGATMVMAGAKEALLQADLATTRRTEVIRRTKAGATIKAPKIRALRNPERVVTLGAAILARVMTLERVAQVPQTMAGVLVLQTTATRAPPAAIGAPETMATRVPQAVVGALEITATQALLATILAMVGALRTTATRVLLTTVGALETAKALLAAAGVLETTRDLLAVVGALETTATRALLVAVGDLEVLTREAQTTAVTVEKVTLATTRAADGKLVFREGIGRIGELMTERK
jgi:hypothetical protein